MEVSKILMNVAQMGVQYIFTRARLWNITSDDFRYHILFCYCYSESLISICFILGNFITKESRTEKNQPLIINELSKTKAQSDSRSKSGGSRISLCTNLPITNHQYTTYGSRNNNN